MSVLAGSLPPSDKMSCKNLCYENTLNMVVNRCRDIER